MTDFIISIHPVYVDAIVRGEKTVEIRRRRAKVMPGDRLWIYATRPRGEVVGCAVVQRTDYDSKRNIWSKYGVSSAIRKSEYDEYVGELVSAFAIEWTSVELLKRPISLEGLRQVRRGFHPPQYVSILEKGSAILRLLLLGSNARKAA